jgi:hypothetical protein
MERQVAVYARADGFVVTRKRGAGVPRAAVGAHRCSVTPKRSSGTRERHLGGEQRKHHAATPHSPMMSPKGTQRVPSNFTSCI